MNKSPIQELIEWAGSQTTLARLLGVTRGAVGQWKVAGIPPARAVQIERLTGGKFRAAVIAREDIAA